MKRPPRPVCFALGFAGALFLIAWVVPFPRERLFPPEAYRFYDRNGSLLGTLMSKDDFMRMHVSADRVSSLFKKTLLLREDRFFRFHLGLNPVSILRAAATNFLRRRVVSGASTVTMQLARMVDRRPRTLWAKVVEGFRAFQLECRYSKNQILAFYLAHAPYGGNIEGIEAASLSYFGKPSSELSVGEAALLVAIPKSPNHLRPDRFPEAAKRERDAVLRLMAAHGLITHAQEKRAENEPIHLSVRKLENVVPHLAWHYRIKDPQRYVWHTTLDYNLQRRVRNVLAAHVRRLADLSITNAAAVVVDNRTGTVLARVGSADYGAFKSQGANDGTRSPRSPGSTLKPFLYGLALDAGVITEKTVLFDIPTNYAGYRPENYSRNFIGLVTAREALTESLNVVAVELSRRLGPEKLYSLLKDGGITSLNRPVSYYGLPLVLGGVEVALDELVDLYGALARGGRYRHHRETLEDPAPKEGKPLLSPEAAWIVSQMLLDVERPDFPESWRFSKNRPTISWKTGTSYGHQDAWSVGYDPSYTIGVWVGNFDAQPSRGLSGSRVASPLLFDLFQAVQQGRAPENWFPRPEGVGTRTVCAICGTRPNDSCEQTTEELYIPARKGPALEATCEVPQKIVVDRRTGRQWSPGDPENQKQFRIFNIWPPEIATFLHKHGVPVRGAPPYVLGNMAGQKYYPPQILSPAANTVYFRRLDKLKKDDHAIKLAAAVTNRVKEVFWFLGNKLIFRGDPMQEILINPAPGTYHLTLMDEVGGKATQDLVVKDFDGTTDGT